MSTVLLIAYHFPPAGGLGAAGSLRALKLARHLPATGWRPVVLTVRESSYESYLTMDPVLQKQVPEHLQVIRTGVFRGLTPILEMKAAIRSRFSTQKDPQSGAGDADGAAPATADSSAAREKRSRFQRFKDALTDLFEIPDEAAGWAIPAFFAGLSAVRRDHVEAIFATGRPWTALVVGATLKLFTRRPLVVDFRDPWMTNPFRIEYSPIKDWAEKKLEAWVVRSADLIVANTDGLRAEFVERFGDDVRDKCITILNGFDPEEFAAVMPEPRRAADRNAFLMTHCGFLYGKRDPRALLEAIRLLRDRGQVEAARFVCEFVGAIKLSYSVPDYLAEHGLADLVHLRGVVSYAESLSALAACDVALLLQPGTQTQVPSKLFEYVGFGKQILAVAPTESAVGRMVTANGLGEVADPDDVEGIAAAILSAYAAWERRGAAARIDPDVQKQFDIRFSAQKLGSGLSKLATTT